MCFCSDKLIKCFFIKFALHGVKFKSINNFLMKLSLSTAAVLLNHANMFY